MKIVIEKVPQGVKLTLNNDSAKKPQVVIFTQQEFESLVNICRAAFSADSFRFEYQTQ